MKKYLINLFRVINTNVGDSILVYIGENEDDFKFHIRVLESLFKDNGTFIKKSIYYKGDGTQVQAYIEYSFTKENKQ